MKKISSPIIESNIDLTLPRRKRYTSRAIILDSSKTKVLLVYSNAFDDYTFPGGGIQKMELPKKALYRELQEEVGARSIQILEDFGEIEEISKGINEYKKFIFYQKSFYFYVKITKYGVQKLDEKELSSGLEPVWVKIDDAIKHNKRKLEEYYITNIGIGTILKREITVLTKLKEFLENEKKI
ncbi:MAG: NUDIX domain-containing protein [Acholeplasmatales bacterium]|jgi:8-oxo-dGTP pyrophosphatase MutT (NUDIX family)|nr:NUDIX domain-containing protein [Acholeplasmatales bacterium]